MKKKYNYLLAAFALLFAATLTTSCEDEPDKYEITGGKPTVSYIRSPFAESSDSLLTSASMSSTICLVGDNLTSVVEMYFNDQKAELNTSYITAHTLLVDVPKNIPVTVTDKIYMITEAKDTVTYDFKVVVPPPVISSVSNEWAKIGEEVTVYGDYFDNANDMLRVKIGDIYADIKEGFTKTTLTFVVPEAAKQGDPFSVETINGSAKSSFLYKDNRGMITDFDGENNSGTKGIVPQGWNLAMKYYTEGGVDGYYAQVGDGELTMPEDGGWTEGFKISWWCGNWSGDPLSITSGAGVPLRYLFSDGYLDNPSKLAFKFEMCIPSSNPWKAGALQVLFMNYEVAANDSWQNNTYIQKEAGLCRGIYRPWSVTGSYDTGDKWVTVTMPLADFTYNMDGTPGVVPLSKESFDSFTMWPLTGGVDGEECAPIIRYDNIRIVPIK